MGLFNLFFGDEHKYKKIILEDRLCEIILDSLKSSENIVFKLVSNKEHLAIVSSEHYVHYLYGYISYLLEYKSFFDKYEISKLSDKNEFLSQIITHFLMTTLYEDSETIKQFTIKCIDKLYANYAIAEKIYRYGVIDALKLIEEDFLLTRGMTFVKNFVLNREVNLSKGTDWFPKTYDEYVEALDELISDEEFIPIIKKENTYYYKESFLDGYPPYDIALFINNCYTLREEGDE